MDNEKVEELRWKPLPKTVLGYRRGLAKQCRGIQVELRVSIDKMGDTQIVHQLLSQLGIKVDQHWSRSVATHEGEKLRVYQLDQAHWQSAWAVLERRAAKREERQQQRQADQPIGELKAGSPLHFGDNQLGG